MGYAAATMTLTKDTKATLAGAAALTLWACLAVLTTATGAMPPFLLVALSFAIGAAIGLLKQVFSGINPLTRLRQPAGTWLLSVSGLFGYHSLYFLALKTAPAVQANLINYLWPLLIVVFAALLPGQRLSIRHLLGAGMGFAGIVLLVNGKGIAGFDWTALPGYGAALGCAVTWAAYSVANRRYAHVPSDTVTGFLAVSALLAGLCHLAFEPAFTLDGRHWAAVAAMGLGPAGLAFFLWDHSMKHGDVRLLGTLGYGTPLASTLLLVAFGQGEMTPTIAVTTLLIVAGAAIAVRRPHSG